MPPSRVFATFWFPHSWVQIVSTDYQNVNAIAGTPVTSATLGHFQDPR